MRSLYWKIFLSFWCTTLLIIVTTAWITSEIAKSSSAPARENAFMDSYANAAVATYESGKKEALNHWLEHIGLSRHMILFLLTKNGQILGDEKPPTIINTIASEFQKNNLDDGIIKLGNIIISHEILSASKQTYRLVAITEKPLSHFIEIPWQGLTIRLLVAAFFSGIICYLLSRYLTQPLRSLTSAAKSIAKGNLNTRVGQLRGHHHDEIAELSQEFDTMAEQLEQLIESKERLLHDISHELRSPLARLHIAIELARKKINYATQPELDRMELEGFRLNTLIGEILDFARLKKDTVILSLHEIDMNELLQSLAEDANFEFGANRVHIKKSHACLINGDERLIHRAIENILRNALHYSPENEPVSISLTEEDTSIIIDIDDKGPGVPENQLEKIFNPFYRVDTSRQKKTGGFGLGLSIAKQAIRIHQGSIEASNKKESGLRVRIILPKQQVTNNEIKIT